MSQLSNEYDFENAPCGYLSFYPDGTIIQINQTLLKWIQYRKEEVVGKKKLDEITPKGTSLYFQMFVYPLLKMQGYINELSVNIVSADAVQTSCLFNASAIKDEGGNILRIHAILFRISERKRYESEILNAKKTAEAVAEHKEHILQVQRRIVSILGHDTRAPLHSIHRMMKLAAEGQIGPDEVIPYFELMANQLDATLILINDLLTWSNAIFNNTNNSEGAFKLHAIAEDVFELLQSNAVAKRLFLKNEISREITLFSNRSIITFIIRNLVNNAIKFTKEGGITVSATASSNEISVTVSDTGVGMSEDVLEKFKSGELDSTLGTESEKGSGMGLVLINEFLLQLRGRLQAESQLNEGTRITIIFPREVGLREDIDPVQTTAVQITD